MDRCFPGRLRVALPKANVEMFGNTRQLNVNQGFHWKTERAQHLTHVKQTDPHEHDTQLGLPKRVVETWGN